MSDVFGPLYAQNYDSFYREKDYEAECDLVERIFGTYGTSSIETVLDLGCGTGNHVLPLATRGYDVVGVDRSPEMLARAREKAAAAGTDRVAFELGDIRTKRFAGRSFDAALVLFAVLGYQTRNADVLATLQTAQSHLRLGGLLLFDVWYGPAVLRERPAQRLKIVETDKGRILRLSDGRVDSAGQLCKVEYRLWSLEGDRLVAETTEEHAMRYFFPLELELFLEIAGFSLLRLGAFPDIDRDPDETTWNVLAVAQRTVAVDGQG